MDNRNIKDIEHLFNEGMQGHEVPYEEGAWESMLPLLEKEDRKPLWIIWFSNQSKTFKTITIMTLLGILTAVGVMLAPMKKEKANVKNEIVVQSEAQRSKPIIEGDIEAYNLTSESTSQKSIDSKMEMRHRSEEPMALLNPLKKLSSSESPLNDSSQIKTGGSMLNGKTDVVSVSKKKISEAKGVIKQVVQFADTITENITITQKKVKVIRKEWVEDRYVYSYHYDETKPIKDFWFGLHYTEQSEGTGWNSTNSGFNFQMMSGDLRKKDNFGVYAGLDWGMMFYGRTPNSNVIINTVNEDSGYTRLRNNSMDFLFRLHYEYSKHKIVPYVNLSAGPRFFYTNQKVASYLNLADNESSSHHNADFTASFMAGAAVGTRIKVAKRVSLDMRYELMYGTKTKQVELDKSTFSGLSYQLSRRTFNPNYNMIKVGVIIDVSESRKEKELVKGHYVERSYDSLIVESTNDSTIIVLPCACDCPEQKNETKRYQNNSDDDDDEDNDSWRPRGNNGGSSGSKSGGSKGSFPGIKTKPPVLK